MDKKANRRTIPSLAAMHSEFSNVSGTMRAVLNPQSPIHPGSLDETESSRLRIDQDTAGIEYMVWSYDTPIAWVTKTGWTYKVEQRITETTSKHMALLYLLPEGKSKT